MSQHARFGADVPATFREGGIVWLVLEHSPETGGWFLFGHERRDGPSQFDNWYEDATSARQQALEDWGVTAEAWRDLK